MVLVREDIEIGERESSVVGVLLKLDKLRGDVKFRGGEIPLLTSLRTMNGG